VSAKGYREWVGGLRRKLTFNRICPHKDPAFPPSRQTTTVAPHHPLTLEHAIYTEPFSLHYKNSHSDPRDQHTGLSEPSSPHPLRRYPHLRSHLSDYIYNLDYQHVFSRRRRSWSRWQVQQAEARRRQALLEGSPAAERRWRGCGHVGRT